VRAIYNPPNAPVLEEDLQNFIARELDRRRGGQYTVVRESEITRKKKPDLRLVYSGCDGPVTLELKVAERWTLPELESALHSQLVGTYMRANNSRFGALVVCSSGPGKKWELGDRLVAVQEVIGHLQAKAKEISRSNEGVDGLAVVWLDFH
jgi:hypothetical protein